MGSSGGASLPPPLVRPLPPEALESGGMWFMLPARAAPTNSFFMYVSRSYAFGEGTVLAPGRGSARKYLHIAWVTCEHFRRAQVYSTGRQKVNSIMGGCPPGVEFKLPGPIPQHFVSEAST